MNAQQIEALELPGLDCGSCGFRTCEDFRKKLKTNPAMLKRCTFLSDDNMNGKKAEKLQKAPGKPEPMMAHSPKDGKCPSAAICGTCRETGTIGTGRNTVSRPSTPWIDSLGRDFDFYLEHFPEDVGPREIIIPHNPMITREMDIQVGDTLIGRPLGMSCGCPITHCGTVVIVDRRTGVLTWCVTGPLGPREKGYKDIGYYIAEGYEGLITDAKCDIKIGMRYYFQPRMCMLQWRHSGLVNYINRSDIGLQVRLEGLWIG